MNKKQKIIDYIIVFIMSLLTVAFSPIFIILLNSFKGKFLYEAPSNFLVTILL